jgi:addiction module HigA family antidote
MKSSMVNAAFHLSSNGKRGISPQFAIVLETVLGTSAEMWARMQAEYDLWEARLKAA